MPTPHVLYEQTGAIAVLTFNRPEARNAMTWEMYQALVDFCDRAESDSAVRVLVLRGAGGKAFVAGTDIAEFRGFASPADGIAYEQRLDAVIDRLERVAVATIAQIDGVVAGGGAAIAAACDLRICTPAARFGVPIARTLGNCLSAANHARFLDLIGPTRLKEMLYTGRLLGPQEALEAGLVNRLVKSEELADAVLEMAATIAANAPLTIRATKEMIRRVQVQRRPAPGTGHDLIGACYGSADFREGVDAFLAKRAPHWRGV